MEYGGFWRRVFALICDSLIASIPAYLVVAALVKSGFDMMGVAVNLASFIVYLAYFVVLQSSTLQTTVGKALLGLKVATVNGERASALRVLGRELGKIVSWIPLGIGFLLAAFTGRKQALHDMIASTVVQRTGPAQPLKGAIVVVVASFALYGVGSTLLGKEFERAMLEAQAGDAPKPAPVVAKAAPKPAAPKPEPAKPQVAAAPEPAKPAAAAPVAIPAAAPVAMTQEKPKPVVEKPRPTPVVEAPKPQAEAPKAEAPKAEAPRAEPMPVIALAAPPAAPGPKFNDMSTAVIYRDAKAVDELIALGRWVDRADSRGMTPLMLAAQQGDAAIAETLLKAGADPNRTGAGGVTPMSIARGRRDGAMEGLLQRHGGR